MNYEKVRQYVQEAYDRILDKWHEDDEPNHETGEWPPHCPACEVSERLSDALLLLGAPVKGLKVGDRVKWFEGGFGTVTNISEAGTEILWDDRERPHIPYSDDDVKRYIKPATTSSEATEQINF